MKFFNILARGSKMRRNKFWMRLALNVLALLTASSLTAATLTAGQTGAVRAVVLNNLKDPGSALFSGLEKIPRADGLDVTCGWVNSKSSHGGYVGKQRFAVLKQKPAAVAYLAEEDADLVSQLCAPLSRQQLDAAIKVAQKERELAEADKLADQRSVCPRAQFNFGATGDCGALYAQCWIDARSMPSDEKKAFMDVCGRKGADAAKALADEFNRAATQAVRDKWPSPTPQVKD